MGLTAFLFIHRLFDVTFILVPLGIAVAKASGLWHILQGNCHRRSPAPVVPTPISCILNFDLSYIIASQEPLGLAAAILHVCLVRILDRPGFWDPNRMKPVFWIWTRLLLGGICRLRGITFRYWRFSSDPSGRW